MTGREIPVKRLIFLIMTAAILALCAGAGADPARTDGTVTAWIGEENELFLKCTDGITRKLSTPMKDILSLTDTDVIGLTQTGQIVSVKKEGTGYSILSAAATETEIAEKTDRTVQLQDGKLTVGETVFSERAAVAATDGKILYWINQSDSGFVLMQKEMPGAATKTAGTLIASLTGKSVPEPISMTVTAEALTITAVDRSILSISLKDGESVPFPASGQATAAACMADGRLYRYRTTELVPWVLETIENDAMLLVTVTPAPTAVPAPTPTPTATPRTTLVPTTAPSGGGSSSRQDDGNIYKGAKGQTVRKIQRRLQELGYPVGYVDGSYGDQTQTAVSLFYEAIRQRERNYITPSMYRRLFANDAPYYDPYAPLQRGDSGLRVRMVQMMLRRVGYDPIQIDGAYGQWTVNAMAAYQQAVGYIPAQGEIPGEYASRGVLEKLLGPDPVPVTNTDL